MKQIVTNIASTFAFAPMAFTGGMSSAGTTLDNFSSSISYETVVEAGSSSQSVKSIITTNIAKYYSANPIEENAFNSIDAKFMSFVNKFAESQIELEDDFLESLNRLEEKNRKSTPTRVKF